MLELGTARARDKACTGGWRRLIAQVGAEPSTHTGDPNTHLGSGSWLGMPAPAVAPPPAALMVHM